MLGSNRALRSSVIAGLRTEISMLRVTRTEPLITPLLSSMKREITPTQLSRSGVTSRRTWNRTRARRTTYIISLITWSWQGAKLKVFYEHKRITAVNSIKFLGLEIDSTLSWKQHIDSIIPRLDKACFAVRQVKSYMALEALKMICFSYFHSIVTYGIIFWGNSVHSQQVFKIQKRIIRLIANLRVKDSCRCTFKKLGILPLYSQYLYSLLLFVAKNREMFQSNSDVHSVGTRYKNDLHLPPARLKLYQQGTFTRELRHTVTYLII